MATRYLRPIGQENGITFRHDSCSGTLWFEPKSAPWIDDPASIERTINVQVESMWADIVMSVDSDLAAWIKSSDCRHAPTADEKPLAAEYERLGVAVLAALDLGLNRFLSFVRIEKGQHWVQHVTLDADRLSSHCVGMRAQARINDSDWFRGRFLT
jgi:hypothetical protein